MQEATPAPAAGYLRVLREAPGYRLLFTARSISLLGDWFALVAVIALLREVLGSDAKALSGMLILRLLPIFLAGPLAGVVADRFSRKRIMIGSDLIRLVLSLALLAAPLAPKPVAFVYVVVAAQVVASAFFDPARSAAIPHLVPPHMLSAANALGAVAWSIAFAVGSALGGVVTDLAGWRTAMVIDAATFAVSAALLSKIVLPRRAERPSGPLDWRTVTGLRDFVEGLRHIGSRPGVSAVITLKAGWGVAGGLTLFLTLFGERVHALYGRPDLGVALLLTARAIGTAIGPIVARRLVPDEEPQRVRWLLGACYAWSLGWYLVFSWTDSPWLAAGCVTLAHFGGSALWVYSTVLLQRTVADEFLGRTMATDLGLATLTMSLSTWAYGVLAADASADLHAQLRFMALTWVVPGAIWWIGSRRLRQHADREDRAIAADPSC